MKTYLFIINLVFLTVAAYLGVDTFYQLAGARLEVVSPSVDAAKKAAKPSKAPVQPLENYQAIHQRNLFKLDKLVFILCAAAIDETCDAVPLTFLFHAN